MNADHDVMLAERFAAIADRTDDGDWGDVIRRLGASSRRSRRSKTPFLLAAGLLAVLAVPAYAIGRAVSGWLAGEPAPPSIVQNFGSYTPQLGFKPESGKAVRVAADGDFTLYATPNDRGSYCVATNTPDGGICVQPSVAALPLTAGIMPAHGVLVAGRVNDSRAARVAFTDPDGAPVTRQIGVGGFFIAAFPSSGLALCEQGDWRPVFKALDKNGDELFAAQITLASKPANAPVGCGWANGPHG